MSDAYQRPSRRPNGRPEACDQCRSRKVACDHRRPNCMKCQKRGETCVYTASTLRARVTTTTQGGPRLLNQSDPEFRTSQSIIPMIREHAFSPGYLGFTSYNSVFQGARESLSIPATSPDPLDINESSADNEDICLRRLPLPTQQMCLVVLQYLPGRPEAHMVFHDEPGPETTTSWSHVAVSRIITSLRQLFKRFDGSVSFDEEVADVLCCNTARPVRDTFDDFNDWIAQFCGPNIRWESIGLLWAHLEGISDALSTLKYRQLQWVEGKRSSVVAHEHLHYCIEITRQFTAGNDMLIDLCRRHAALATLVYGDASHVYWNAHSLCVSMLVFLGLHAPADIPKSKGKSETPSFCVENRRFQYCYIFNSDKIMVSFTGRPPLLSRRYCSSRPPSDLSDSCLLSKTAMTEEFVALDDSGWNSKGEIYANSYMRARFLQSYLFDEVIEIALGNDAHVTLEYLE